MRKGTEPGVQQRQTQNLGHRSRPQQPQDLTPVSRICIPSLYTQAPLSEGLELPAALLPVPNSFD